MNTITLKQTLPEVFSSRDDIRSDIWHQELSFRKGEICLIEAGSGKGKSSLCSYIYGYRDDYQGLICFDGKNIRNFAVKDWVEMRKKSLSLLFQELRLFPELTASQVKEILKQSVRPMLTDGKRYSSSGGIVDALAAVKLAIKYRL